MLGRSLGMVPPPKVLEAFPTAGRTRPKTPISGGGGLRARWRDDDNIYEWDCQHGHVEVFDRRGTHRGAFGAADGRRLTGADSTRRVEP